MVVMCGRAGSSSVSLLCFSRAVSPRRPLPNQRTCQAFRFPNRKTGDASPNQGSAGVCGVRDVASGFAAVDKQASDDLPLLFWVAAKTIGLFWSPTTLRAYGRQSQCSSAVLYTKTQLFSLSLSLDLERPLTA